MRDLIELRIDDQLRGSESHAYIISGWVEAQRFWRNSQAVIPDIVLCDINFDRDRESPLSSISHKKPTGLLYALPFLAAAKVHAAPLVMAFHTGDRSLFTRLHAQERVASGDAPPDAMRALAAELLGLITAMLGVPNKVGHFSEQESLDWLGRQRAVSDNADDAAEEARARYRQALMALCTNSNIGMGKRVIVDPHWYKRLVAWCAQVHVSALQGADIWSGDPGLRVIYENGSTDHIAIRSLFGTTEMRRFRSTAFNITLGEAESNRLMEDGWLRDECPMVGAFVGSIGHWPRLHHQACEALDRFPTSPSSLNDGTLADYFKRSNPDHAVLRVLALVFQMVRFYREAVDQWDAVYLKTGWNPVSLSHRQTGTSLRDFLRELYTGLAKLPNPTIDDFSDVFWSLSKAFTPDNGDSVTFHFELLKSLGLVDTALGSNKDLQIGPAKPMVWDRLPQIPERFRSHHLNHPINSLAVSFGYKENGASKVVGRIVDDFFGAEPGIGNRFVHDLIAGKLPSWLSRLAYQYAYDWLEWTDVAADRLRLVVPSWLRLAPNDDV